MNTNKLLKNLNSRINKLYEKVFDERNPSLSQLEFWNLIYKKSFMNYTSSFMPIKCLASSFYNVSFDEN